MSKNKCIYCNNRILLPYYETFKYKSIGGVKKINICLECGKPLYYFNQCDDCNRKMINCAKLMY